MWSVRPCRVVNIVRVRVGECMGLLEVGEWLREYVCIFSGFAGMRSLVGGIVLRGGSIGKRECPLEDIKVSAFAWDINALAG